MRVSKVKRRRMAWARYVAKTGSHTANKFLGGYHRAEIRAHWDAGIAKRHAPMIGIRALHLARWMER